MRLHRRAASRLLGLVAAAAVWPLASMAFAGVELGQAIENEELPVLTGGREPLLGKKALANVFVFFRPNQEHSVDTLRQMARCEKDLAGKPVHWVAIVSDGFPAADVKAVVQDTGIQMPVLVDRGDALYSRFGVRLHPVVGIADARHRLVAYQPFEKINYCESVKARIRFLIGEIDQAQLDQVLSPPKATMPGAEASSVAKRDVNLGKRQLQQKSFEKALASAQKAMERDPTLAAAQALRGNALAGLGRCDEALKAFDEALKLDPKDPAALEGRKACGK